MSSIHKTAFRIVGLFAIIASVAFLAINVSHLNQWTTLERFLAQVIDLAINCLGIYGGFQLIRLRKAGHQLLLIWLFSRIFTVVLVILMLITNVFFSGNNQFDIPTPILLPLILTYYVFAPFVLVYLLATRASQELLVNENPRHTRIVLKLLSLLTPGLARAWVGSPLVGMTLFYVYSLLISYGRFDGTEELHLGSFYVTSPGYWTNFFGKVALWLIFANLDWAMIRKHEKSERERLIPGPGLDSSQVQ